MPNIPGLVISALLNGGITQYPDPQTYNAAKLLQPAERPTVPVRMVEPTDHYNHESARKGFVNAFVKEPRDTVYVSKRAPYLKDPKGLAAVLAHEQRHVNGEGEDQGYKTQYEVLKRLVRGNPAYNSQLEDLELYAKIYKNSAERAKQKK